MNRNKSCPLESGRREIISVPAVAEAGTQPRGGTKCTKPSGKISATPSNAPRRSRVFDDTSKVSKALEISLLLFSRPDHGPTLTGNNETLCRSSCSGRGLYKVSYIRTTVILTTKQMI
jgi:hypothetical protein